MVQLDWLNWIPGLHVHVVRHHNATGQHAFAVPAEWVRNKEFLFRIFLAGLLDSLTLLLPLSQVQRVQEMFPHVSRESVAADLSATRSVEDTIENILSGVLSHPPEAAAGELQVCPMYLSLYAIPKMLHTHTHATVGLRLRSIQFNSILQSTADHAGSFDQTPATHSGGEQQNIERLQRRTAASSPWVGPQ